MAASSDSTPPATFAIVLDNQIITVPLIDYTQYPEGLVGTGSPHSVCVQLLREKYAR